MNRWWSLARPPSGGGDGHWITGAERDGSYAYWGLVPFLEYQQRNPDTTMAIHVHADQILRHTMVNQQSPSPLPFRFTPVLPSFFMLC